MDRLVVSKQHSCCCCLLLLQLLLYQVHSGICHHGQISLTFWHFPKPQSVQ